MAFVVTRYRNRVKRVVKFEVVTPMFLGGADGKTASIRVPSLRGVLRFWWRASSEGDLEELKAREADIFGNTEKKSPLEICWTGKTGVRTNSHPLPPGTFVDAGKGRRTSIIGYLGYGLQKPTGGKLDREYIESGESFSLEFLYPEHIDEDVERSLSLLHSFGGLGSRSRNGFGSLQIEGRRLLSCEDVSTAGDLKDFTAFSRDSRLFTFGEHNSWVEALSEAGVAYRKARLSLESRHEGERRRYVSLPLNIRGGANYSGRHAKPYFLHVHKTEGGLYQSRILFLPYRYTYKRGRYEEYRDVCASMNSVLRQEAGGGA